MFTSTKQCKDPCETPTKTNITLNNTSNFKTQEMLVKAEHLNPVAYKVCVPNINTINWNQTALVQNGDPVLVSPACFQGAWFTSIFLGHFSKHPLLLRSMCIWDLFQPNATKVTGFDDPFNFIYLRTAGKIPRHERLQPSMLVAPRLLSHLLCS